MRLFFALDISHENKQQIADWCNQCLPDLVKPVAVDNFHITLSFLGQVTQKQQQHLESFVDNLVSQHKPITENTLQLNHLGLFQKPKVLYLGLENTPKWLEQLAHQLKQEVLTLNIFQENRPYCPHLTVARKATTIPLQSPFELPICISSFSLYESRSTDKGVAYLPLHTWQISNFK